MDTLKISTFHIRNFKSIRDSNAIDIDDLNILIGKNDAGKSSVLEALQCFLNKGKPSSSHFHKQDTEEIVLSATFSGITDDFRNALGDDYTVEGDIVEIVREFEHRGDTTPGATTYLNGEELSSGAIVEEGDELTKAQSRNFLWDHFLPNPILIPAERDVNEEVKLKGGTVLNRLLEPILENRGVEDGNSFRENVEDLENELKNTATSVGSDLTSRMQSHMPDVADIEINTGSLDLSKAISPTIRIKDEYLDQSVDIAERGSGVGSLLILSLMQTYVDMQVGEGYCLLFEEPENFLHPAAERKMSDALRDISEEGQVCISTHSHRVMCR
jgi:putative ATP-dependent endonuclease of OLD family